MSLSTRAVSNLHFSSVEHKMPFKKMAKTTLKEDTVKVMRVNK